MAIDKMDVETKPCLLQLNQVEIPSKHSGTAKSILNSVAETLQTLQVNSILPVACAIEKTNKYRLLTGLPIYEAAKIAGLKELWVFVVATPTREIGKIIEQMLMLTKLNETVIEEQDVTEFLAFLNNKKSDLTAIRGIGEKNAQKIVSHRPFTSLEDMQEKLGNKRTFNWLRAYKLVL